jgi:small subunit ribosomal protein S9
MVTEKKTKGKYFYGLGRRKTSVARVRLYSGEKPEIIVNDKAFSDYFPTFELQNIVQSALEKLKIQERFRIVVKAKGGGIHSQAEALNHGISRALVKWDEDKTKKYLKRAGYLTRDPRMTERKKFGFKKARRAPQWSKR